MRRETNRKVIRIDIVKLSLFSVFLLSAVLVVRAAPGHEGQVRFGETPVPGAVVQATQGTTTVRAVTDADGRYTMADLADGTWMMQVDTPGFETVRREITVSADAMPAQWDLKMLPLENIQAGTPVTGFPSEASAPILQSGTPSDEAASRLLINGTVSNGASTPFALARAIGNNRAGQRSPYNGSVGFVINNAVFDARSFSLTGQDTAKPAYSRAQGGFTLGGPFRIPGHARNGNFTINYARNQNRNASVQTALMPTDAERNGDFSSSATPVIDPVTGTPFGGNMIPSARIVPQASALLNLYPSQNFSGSSRYNYQVPVVGTTHTDSGQGVLNNFAINNSHRLTLSAGFQSSRSDNPDLFGFTDTARQTGLNANVVWNWRFTQRTLATIRYQFTNSVNETKPYFGGQNDVSAIAGISGNDRDPRNWGPPALNFSSGIARLATGTYANDRSLSHLVSYASTWVHGRHGWSYGADYRWQEFNLFSQRDPRGSFTFTGATTGKDFADFLLGIPAASSIAYGNADKYFRQSFANVFISDDWRWKPSLTLTLGVRWEYEAPITEKYGRLVNLDIDPAFASATPQVAGTPDESLVRTDKGGFEPRLALAWRPRAASSLVVRAGYGLYRDTSVYRSVADQMAQQSPLSRSLSVQNTPANPLTLADGFRAAPTMTEATFAIDPDFRVGTAQNWNVSIQQDLPAALQISVTYLGVKGTHVPQRILPNTYPAGTTSPCSTCPAGFVYLMSGGSSSRHAGTVELRRRQRNGFQASAQYTYSKSIDDAGLAGNSISQNWLDRRAERALSNFDQRHLLTVQEQYTTGSFTRVGGFWDGWRGKVAKEWTLTAQLTVGSGSPLTPTILAPVQGTGNTGTLRPDVTGQPVYLESGGGFLNSAAFALPPAGQWGNAGRNSITGPSQFSLNASLTRTFRINERVNLDVRVDANNVLNHVTFPNWNTTVNSLQFGFPVRANSMRTLQPSVRMRF